MNRLFKYFTQGVASTTLPTAGAEVETQFVDKSGKAITTEMSQKMLGYLVANKWKITATKGQLITTLTDWQGNKIFYELGRHNLEVSTVASTTKNVVPLTRYCLGQIYKAAELVGALPYFGPILAGNEDLLVIPDERDAVWLELDGRKALAPLARTSSVQFTVSVGLRNALSSLNKLGNNIGLFLKDYPQESVWKSYIKDSLAPYRTDRYGGPLLFDSLGDYCQAIAMHSVVQGKKLVPLKDVKDLDIPLYLRSIWWYFRFKRYGNALCIEVRPMPRRSDTMLESQLQKVLDII